MHCKIKESFNKFPTDRFQGLLYGPLQGTTPSDPLHGPAQNNIEKELMKENN